MRRRIDVIAVAVAALFAAALLGPSVASAERVNYRANAPEAPRTFFEHGGLQLIGECEGDETINITADTNFDDALIHYNAQKDPASHAARFDNDFNETGSDAHLITSELNVTDSAMGQIVYARPGGTNVTVYWQLENDAPLVGGKACLFTGHARVVSSGDSDRVNFRSNTGPGIDFQAFSGGGLTLAQNGAASCLPGGQTTEVSARSAVDDAMVGEYGQRTNDTQDGFFLHSEQEPNFDSGFDNRLELTNSSMDNDSSGHVVYARSGGTNVSADYAAEEGTDLLGDKNCVFVGSARIAASGSTHRVNFRPDSDQNTPVKFFELGGLKLKASCNNSQLTVQAKTDYDDAILHWNGQQPANAGAYAEEDHFGTAMTLDLFDELGLSAPVGGQILYSRPGGVNVTVDWTAEQNDLPLGGTRFCAFVGTAEKNTP